MRPTADDYTKIRDYILYHHLLDMIRHNVDMMRGNTSALTKLYVLAGEKLHDRIYRDFAELRKEFRERSVKVWEGQHGEMVLHYHFVFDGFEDKFSIVKEVLRAEMSIRLAEYVKEVGEKK